MVGLQDSILERLYDHTLSNMLFNRIFETNCVRILSCFGLGAGIWFTTRPTFPTFQLSLPSFFTMFQTWFGLPHPSIVGIFQCVCTHPINVINVHLLHCTHENERMGTHDAVCNIFATIAWDVIFHVGRKQLDTLPLTTFHSFCQWVDILLTKDGIHTVVDVVITDPTWVYLLCWFYTTWGFVTFEVAQAKKKSYCDQHPTNHFLPLAINVFGCLEKQANVFLHDCANAMWNFKRLKSLLLFVLVIFFHKKILITLQEL
jgi:hypothetical protein